MTQNEAIEQVISQPKYYIGVMPQSTASHFVASWRKGMAKQSTITKFLNKFGYTIKTEAQWEKK